MKFPQDFIDRVRESTSLVDLVSQYVQLRRTGDNHVGLCPFHHDKSPSFSVSEAKQVYHCFACKASGNVFTFVQNYQGMTFPETIEYLAKRASLPLPEVKGDASSSPQDFKSTFFKVNALAGQFYHSELKRLPTSHPARAYLEGRGLNEELVDTYKLGYAPAAWSELSHVFETKRVPMPAAEQLGLVKHRTGGKSGYYDMFRDRLIFPIFSPAGQCVGFGGRVLEKGQQPKYLNSPDSPVFHKGRVFYGLNHSAKHIRSEDEVIVVEGYMDWLALAKVSIQNVVATLGTAFTPDHAKLIRRYTNRVLLLFDGDDAGKSAARRSLPVLLSAGLLARGLFLPENLDPDDFIKKYGETDLRRLLAGAPDLFDLVSAAAVKAAKGSPTGKIQVLDELTPLLGAIEDRRLRQLYARNLSNLLDIDMKIIMQSIANLSKKGSASGPAAGNPRSVTPRSAPIHPRISTDSSTSSRPGLDLSQAPRVELELLNVILMKEVYLKEALKSGVGDELLHPGCQNVFRRIAEVYGQMPSKFDSLSALLADEVQPAETITRHLSEPYTKLPEDALGKLLQDCIKRVKTDYLRSKSKEILSSLRGSSSANAADQLEQIMNIHRNRRSLNRDS
ncbi:MAG: DNA primase [Bdellovibrionales bacterium]